ncbi:VOC family protein [Marinibaculum pumilum]|uniref:VOC family protein n=1 Tax=Marinibaculum pumilum TaxID=1766165 RepID=A0ABV7KXN9_9PROT
MPVKKLEHYTIRCSDLERTKDFYCNILGLEVGPRPPFAFRGYWLYAGDTPSVHLVDRAETQPVSGKRHTAEDTGPVDHVAFLARDLEATIAMLRDHDVPFREGSLQGVMHQIFLADPDNITVELTFREGEG